MNSRRKNSFFDIFSGYLFTSPLIVYCAVFLIIPILMAFFIGFTRWDMHTAPVWIGLENYRDIFLSPARQLHFWKSIFVTVKYVFLVVPAGLLLSLLLAMVLNRKIRGENFFKASFFLPSLTTAVAVASIWKWLYDPAGGLLNRMVVWMGGAPINWLNDANFALPSIAFMSIWQSVGYNALIFLVGLKSIPQELFDSIKVDGGDVHQTFWYVTLPMLRPVTFFLVITSVIGSFQSFDSIYVLTSGLGSPERSTLVYVLNIYNQAFRYYDMGVACAMSNILFAIIVSATWLQFKYLPRSFQ